ncbi:MAG: hypothetical protein VX498_14350 [Myxococcota bacterium]|nr:hypothetical protein [Myxococcota bacterium]
MTQGFVSRFGWLFCLPALVLALGCQPAFDEAEVDGFTELEAMMVGHWVVQQANVTFFDSVMGDPISLPADVYPDHAVPVDFLVNPNPVMVQFGGDFLFGDGWSRVALTVIEDGKYIRNAADELEANPPPTDEELAADTGPNGIWDIDEALRMVLLTGDGQHIEAMVDMAEDGASVWLDYDREAPLFSGSSCINSVYMERVE